jgi:UDP-N-acetylmuramoyl-L-alanyl-D-glutamate--2,6-diaminopimelate ligase
MLVAEVLANLKAVAVHAGAEREAAGVEYDSRCVTAGSVFVAMRGGVTDGNRYVEGAIAAGAVGVVTDTREVFERVRAEHSAVSVALVEHGRDALAAAAANYFGHP